MLTPGANRIGATMRFYARFVDSGGAVFEPDTVDVQIYKPSGPVTAFIYLVDSQLIRIGVGTYFIDYAPTEAGRWYIRWNATEGTAKIVLEENFIVQVSPFVKTPYESRGDYQ